MNINLAVKTKAEDIYFGNGLTFDACRVTELAAIACYDFIGRGDEKAADQAAVNSMRNELNKLNINGTIVIGEGERDKAPMLYIGEKVGLAKSSSPVVQIALDPLEGTTICATGNVNSITVIAMTENGTFLNAPDVYMDKIAVGGDLPEGVINIEDSPLKNLQNLAKAKKCDISDLTAVILKRSRHEELIAKVREAGAKIHLIGDGDVAGVISTSLANMPADIYMGSGGAPEGVLAAAALLSTGGQMQGKLLFSSEEEKSRAKRMGIADFSKIYNLNELANGDVVFAMTGVTDGFMVNGVKKHNNSFTTESIVMRAGSGKSHFIRTQHKF